jgi:hypothetical protein
LAVLGFLVICNYMTRSPNMWFADSRLPKLIAKFG